MRVLLTGQSGVQAEQIFRRFAAESTLFNERDAPCFFKVEDEMSLQFRKGKAGRTGPSIWVREVLAQPIVELRRLWIDAFRTCIEKATSVDSPDRLVVVNMHSVFYHCYTVEYISLLDTELLKEFSPNIVVTLIDDVYDIHGRLRAPGQIFDPGIAGAPSEIKALFQLQLLLDWRSKEIMMARQIAYDCKRCPHYVFAIKHSPETLYNLTVRMAERVYLSHPISQVRRLLGSDDRADQHKARAIIKTIEEIEDAAKRELALFSPTTIDELRVYSSVRRGVRRFQSQLTERWNAAKYQQGSGTLYAPPQSGSQDPLWENAAADEATLESLAPVLDVLVDHIGRHISARDHKLVEQCDNLLVFRPFFCGNASSGVRKELDYFQAFKRVERGNRFCLIVMPQEDTVNLKVQFIEDKLKVALKLGRLTYTGAGPAQIRFTNDEWHDLARLVDAGVPAVEGFLEQIVSSRKLDFTGRVSLESDTPIEGPSRLSEIAAAALGDAEALVKFYEECADCVERRSGLGGQAIVDIFVEQLNKRKL